MRSTSRYYKLRTAFRPPPNDSASALHPPHRRAVAFRSIMGARLLRNYDDEPRNETGDESRNGTRNRRASNRIRSLPPRMGIFAGLPNPGVVRGRQVWDISALGRLPRAGVRERVVPADKPCEAAFTLKVTLK